jgi:Peptidase family M48
MKPIWMHVTYGTVILVGAVALVRNLQSQKQATQAAADTVVTTGSQLADIGKITVLEITRALLGPGPLRLQGETAPDAQVLRPLLIEALLGAIERGIGADSNLPALSLADENVKGDSDHQKRLTTFTEYTDPILNQRLQQLAQPIYKECKRKTSGYTITVINSAEIDAYSAIGGYIYVSTGLIAKYPSDAALQFVLAHEIGHIELGHAARRYATIENVRQRIEKQRIETTRDGLGPDAYSHFARGYDSDLELQADSFAFQAMLKHGSTSDEATEFLRRAVRVEADGRGTSSSPTGRPDNFAAAVEASLYCHFKGQPAATARLKKLLEPSSVAAKSIAST